MLIILYVDIIILNSKNCLTQILLFMSIEILGEHYFPGLNSGEKIIPSPRFVNYSRDSARWAEADKDQRALAHRLFFDNLDLTEMFGGYYGEDIENMSGGVLVAMDHLIESYESQDPVHAMIFLDKSARPGHYLLRQTIAQTIAIDPSRKKIFAPYQANFLNIGKGPAIEVTLESSYMKQVFAYPYLRSLNQSKRILVIDEYCSSGTSLRAAVNYVSSLFPEAKIEGLQLFSDLPKWYARGNILGVHAYDDSYVSHFRDISYKFKEKALSRMGIENLRQLIRALRIVEGENLQSLSKANIHAMRKAGINLKEIQSISSTLAKSLKVSEKTLSIYLRSFGGLTVVPRKEKSRIVINNHRQYLKELARILVENQLIYIK